MAKLSTEFEEANSSKVQAAIIDAFPYINREFGEIKKESLPLSFQPRRLFLGKVYVFLASSLTAEGERVRDVSPQVNDSRLPI